MSHADFIIESRSQGPYEQVEYAILYWEDIPLASGLFERYESYTHLTVLPQDVDDLHKESERMNAFIARNQESGFAPNDAGTRVVKRTVTGTAWECPHPSTRSKFHDEVCNVCNRVTGPTKATGVAK